MSCSDSVSTPKPRGFYRIDLPQSQYVDFTADDLPYTFRVSPFVTVELPPVDTVGNWVNLVYPELNTKMYCSYFQIKPADLSVLEAECRELVSRNVKTADAITEQQYESPDNHVYGLLFRIAGETASPIQFMLTDSVTHFFRGALYYDCKPNADSIAPVTQYFNDHIIELIQSFHWK